MFCIFDTETSGLFNFALPADAIGQPRLASIAMLTCDENLRLVAAVSFLIKPEGWQMPPEAEAINGLSTVLLNEHGIPPKDALDQYTQKIDAGMTMVAHNAQYDTKIMRGEMRRASFADRYESTATFCTMQFLTDICRIRKPNGGYKWPKLSEAVSYCLGRDHANAHGALPDALACLDLLRWIKAKGHSISVQPKG